MKRERRFIAGEPTRVFESGAAPEVEKLLGEGPHFTGSSSDVLRRLSASSVLQRLSPAEILFDADDVPEHYWFVRSGLVLSSILLSTGRSLAIDLSRPGEGLVEASILGSGRSSFQVGALVDSVVVGVPMGLCREEILRDPENVKRHARHLAAKLVESQQMRLLAIESAPRRVVYALIWLVGKLGRTLPVTREVIAGVAGLPAAAVDRALSPLEKRNWIRTSNGNIHVLQPDMVVKSL